MGRGGGKEENGGREDREVGGGRGGGGEEKKKMEEQEEEKKTTHAKTFITYRIVTVPATNILATAVFGSGSPLFELY